MLITRSDDGDFERALGLAYMSIAFERSGASSFAMCTQPAIGTTFPRRGLKAQRSLTISRTPPSIGAKELRHRFLFSSDFTMTEEQETLRTQAG